MNDLNLEVQKRELFALLSRLYISPLRSTDFIIGYMLPILPHLAVVLAYAVSVTAIAIIVFLKRNNK